MGQVSRVALENGGKVHGIIPSAVRPLPSLPPSNFADFRFLSLL